MHIVVIVFKPKPDCAVSHVVQRDSQHSASRFGHEALGQSRPVSIAVHMPVGVQHLSSGEPKVEQSRFAKKLPRVQRIIAPEHPHEFQQRPTTYNDQKDGRMRRRGEETMTHRG